MTSEPQFLLWAIGLGALSAVSLPLGSAAGLILRPPLRVGAVLAAFGAGALLAALSVELVAPTVAALGEKGADREHVVTAFWLLIAGAIVGGLIFIGLDHLVAAQGGFLRKPSTLIRRFRGEQTAEAQRMLNDLCTVSPLRALPAEEVGRLVRDVHPARYSDAKVLFQEGEQGDALFFIRDGALDLYHGEHRIQSLGRGDVVGELALVTSAPHVVTAKVRGFLEVLALRRDDFERWRRECPDLDAAVRKLVSERLAEYRTHTDRDHEETRAWAQRAISALPTGVPVPTPTEIRMMSAEYKGSPLAVWLGLLLDGIPESIVIGAGFLSMVQMKLAAGTAVTLGEVVPYTLIAGLFLSNFPEAMSSSMNMRVQMWTPGHIVALWVILMVVTAIGAGAGYLVGSTVSHGILVGIEGLAAGAMLTVITATMIPEAVHLVGGNLIGLSTLLGFLSTVAFKLIE